MLGIGLHIHTVLSFLALTELQPKSRRCVQPTLAAGLQAFCELSTLVLTISSLLVLLAR